MRWQRGSSCSLPSCLTIVIISRTYSSPQRSSAPSHKCHSHSFESHNTATAAMSFLRSSVRAVALAILFVSSTTAQTCYYPDGTESGDVSCGSSGLQASCCGKTQVCMDNGLCFGNGIMSRGSCTDKNWESESCSQFCSGGMYQCNMARSKEAAHSDDDFSFSKCKHTSYGLH